MPQGLCHRTMLLLLLFCVWFFLKPLACGSVGVCDVNCCSSTYKIICILSASKARGAWVWPSLLSSAAQMTDSAVSRLSRFFFLRRLPRKRRRAFVCTSLSRDYNISGVYSARHCLLPSCEILIFLCSAHTECSRRFDCLCAKHIIYF
jgi:hypothetical protein